MDQDKIAISIRTRSNVPADFVQQWESRGVFFEKINQSPLHLGGIYKAYTPVDLLAALQKDENILSIEYAGQEDRHKCLNKSAALIQADQCWVQYDSNLNPITGKGITIGVADDPPDIFHPLFFRADGDTLDWTDVNQNGQFDGGTDGIDLDDNGTIDADEILHYINAPVLDYWELFEKTQDAYEPQYDWLFIDSNSNGIRDYGTSAGFTETDPAYGEPLFICIDSNKNNRLNSDEPLVQLSSSKIKAIREYMGLDENFNPVYRILERGVDLIELNTINSHGTAVGGILAGGWPGVNALTGIAPDADLVYGTLEYLAEADVNLVTYEQGWYSQEYLDGSSHEEIMMDSLAARGVIPVIPSGNMNLADVHMEADIPPNNSISFSVTWPIIQDNNGTPFFLSFLFTDQDSLFDFSLLSPDGQYFKLDATSEITPSMLFNIWTTHQQSERGTGRYDIVLYRLNRVGSDWTITIKNPSNTTRHLDGYAYDPRFGWEHGAFFNAYATKNATVTLPATADSAVTVGSFNIRTTNQPAGELSTFSGIGPRIDGMECVDITAPGKLIFTPDVNTRYPQFSGGYRSVEGTSFSGPHAAGAIALMLQIDSTLSVVQIRSLLAQGALQDELTGSTPNNAWGSGKLQIFNTLKAMPQTISGIKTGKTPKTTRLVQNYPNPFNNNTTIAYQLEKPSRVNIEIYNITGQRIDHLFSGTQTAGNYELIWQAAAHPSGIYFIRLATNSNTLIKKCTLLR